MVGAGLPSLRVAFGARDPKVGGSGVEDDREVLQRGAKLWRREGGEGGNEKEKKNNEEKERDNLGLRRIPSLSVQLAKEETEGRKKKKRRKTG